MAQKINALVYQGMHPHPDLDEAARLAAARSDPAAFEQLYLAYVQPLYRYLYSRVGSVPEAEDLTAQTFLAALEGLDRYRHAGHFAAWLFTIGRRKLVDHYRQQRRQAGLEDADRLAVESDLLPRAIRSERSVALSGLIRDLAEGERDLIRLRYVAELSFAEIGALLGRSEEAVKKTLYRLLARLQNQLEKSDD